MLSGPGLLVAIFLAIVFIIFASSVLRLHPFLALLLATLGLGLGINMPAETLVQAIQSGFGDLLGYIGLIVVLGSIIGVVLEKSGAAMRIADLVLRLLGPRRPALAMSIIGAIVSIPVFCDSGFIILSRLNRALSERTGVPPATLALALGAGLYTTHTLIPPTPGPVAAAGNLGATEHLGIIILIGSLVALPTLSIAYLLARRLGARLEVENLEVNALEEKALPPAWKAVGPIVLPIVLIAAASMLSMWGSEGKPAEVIYFLGHPVMALLLGTLLSFSLFPRFDQEHLNGWIGEGIKLAGPILIITGAGGAFGSVLKATPLAELIGGWLEGGRYGGAVMLLLTWAIAALLKTAQGSSTSALVITSSMVAPLLGIMGFDTPVELALMVMAIGGGAMTVSHANDSYFWVVSQFSGINMRDAYRSYTLITGAQGLTVLAITLVLYLIT